MCRHLSESSDYLGLDPDSCYSLHCTINPQRGGSENWVTMAAVYCPLTQVNSTPDSKNKGIKRPGKLYRRLTEGPQESYTPSQTKTFTNSRKKAKITAIFHRVYKTRQYGTPPQSLLLLLNYSN